MMLAIVGFVVSVVLVSYELHYEPLWTRFKLQKASQPKQATLNWDSGTMLVDSQCLLVCS